MISISAILRHTCTPNVSPHVSVCTVVHIHVHVYENHEFCILKSGAKKHFITQSTWSQIILALQLHCSGYQNINDLATCACVTIDDFSEIGSYLP